MTEQDRFAPIYGLREDNLRAIEFLGIDTDAARNRELTDNSTTRDALRFIEQHPGRELRSALNGRIRQLHGQRPPEIVYQGIPNGSPQLPIHIDLRETDRTRVF